uniref:Uncharacterized protein n=1 Tax=Rhizophora mucronata TaxID=61149 RepID=A0A2P2M5H2_RHIMU
MEGVMNNNHITFACFPRLAFMEYHYKESDKIQNRTCNRANGKTLLTKKKKKK